MKVYGRYLRYMKVYEGIWKYMEVYKVYPGILKNPPSLARSLDRPLARSPLARPLARSPPRSPPRSLARDQIIFSTLWGGTCSTLFFSIF